MAIESSKFEIVSLVYSDWLGVNINLDYYSYFLINFIGLGVVTNYLALLCKIVIYYGWAYCIGVFGWAIVLKVKGE